ncbi:MAG: radical SAM protein [Bacteroidia bacterium]|nr:radical SAM protein [Bacteroidia bacterium]GIV23924.1 MAG: radical SAM protein [Bacteroidia bacterium]
MGGLLRRRPVLANYYLTYRCNAACTFCDIWEKPSPYATPERVIENLRALRKLGVRIIDFTGGEPLLHRDLPLFLEAAQRMGFITTVTTNGLLYPKRAHQLRGKIDMLHFSLDAATAEKHDRLRGGVPCFAFVKESLKIATQLGEKPDILFTVTPENWQDIEGVYEQFVRPHKLILILNPVFAYNSVGANHLPAEAVRALRRWGRRPDVYLNEAFLRLRAEGGNSPYAPVCRAASATIVISPDNRLLLPCYHAHEQGYSFPIDRPLAELYHSPAVAHLRQLEGRFSFCEGCVINCYMEPSFAVEVSRYFWASLPSTLRYVWRKWGFWGSLRLWMRTVWPPEKRKGGQLKLTAPLQPVLSG